MENNVYRPNLFENKKTVEVLIRLLSRYSLLPEIFDFFNDPKQTIDFLSTFAGLVIQFPSLESLKSILISVDIVMRIEMNKDKNTKEVLKSIQNDYSISISNIKKIYKLVKSRLLINDEEELDNTFNIMFQILHGGKDVSKMEREIRNRLRTLNIRT